MPPSRVYPYRAYIQHLVYQLSHSGSRIGLWGFGDVIKDINLPHFSHYGHMRSYFVNIRYNMAIRMAF